MYPYVFQTESFAIRWENVLIMVGILAALWLAHHRAAPKGRDYQDMLLDLAIWLIPAGIVGGRAWEMAFTWNEYVDRPWDRMAIWQGGMSIQGCILGGLVALLVFAWRRRVRPWELMDLLAPPVLLGQAIGRIGCLTSGDAFGRPISEVPWWPKALGVIYHPESPAYMVFGPTPLVPAEAMEGLLDFAVLALLLWYKPRHEVPGRVVLLYGLLYSAIRFSLEFLRADSLMVGPLKAAQMISVVAAAVCTALLAMQYRKHAQPTTKAAG